MVRTFLQGVAAACAAVMVQRVWCDEEDAAERALRRCRDLQQRKEVLQSLELMDDREAQQLIAEMLIGRRPCGDLSPYQHSAEDDPRGASDALDELLA